MLNLEEFKDFVFWSSATVMRSCISAMHGFEVAISFLFLEYANEGALDVLPTSLSADMVVSWKR